MVSCLVLSHGKVAQAYMEASKQIIGECKNLYTLSCDGLTPKILYDSITHLIESKNLKDGLFILVSLKGGTCWNVAARIAKEYEKIELISGINLSIILSFVTKSPQYRFEELGDILFNDGIRGICRLK
ncbi:MAG: PTS sugar transporter subunit IIA [bacterium]